MDLQAQDDDCRDRSPQRLARLAQALEHPLRARLFGEVGQRPLKPPELAALLDISLARVAYHSRVLEEAGGVVRDEEGLRRLEADDADDDSMR